MSIVMILHYLKEIKEFFDPSSSGFLFESFIAGFFPDAIVIANNSSVDVIVEKKAYQLKLIDNYGSCDIKENNNSLLDYYIIGLKYADKIDVYVLEGNENSNQFVGDFLTDARKLSTSKLKKRGISYTLELLNLDSKINDIGEGLKESLNTLYENLSQFQYNVETILTGVDERGKLLDDNEFIDISKNSERNVEIMSNELSNLIDQVGLN
jgi:hypothetical protein